MDNKREYKVGNVLICRKGDEFLSWGKMCTILDKSEGLYKLEYSDKVYSEDYLNKYFDIIDYI